MGGPVGVWLAYILMSIIVYSMMVALGEMAALYPLAGGFTYYASRFVDPALGFATGWNYFYCWAISIPVEIVASAIVIEYWGESFRVQRNACTDTPDTHTNAAIYMTICFVLMVVINFLGARAYGEAEFWFSSMKVIAIVGLIILGVILMAGGGPNHDVIGFRYWAHPGPFNQLSIENGDASIIGAWGRFLAFFAVLVQAAFS